ncbi:TPA: hypothetical protein HA251_07975 [Candidatus Woesearchaeota archaeon]|nr:hypothetical protein [Candidatus Woesearchaeota archaeon]
MGLFNTSAKDRARHTLVKAQQIERHAISVVHELRKIEHDLEELRKALPDAAPGDSLQGFQSAMEISERHIEQLETHLKDIKGKLERFREHIKNTKQ